ncbi:hypothetical protein WJ542_11305 [Paraburkholderia sp. B3]|uniref:hypothetical protein n=1 Tax=Paraburkholderia sp. B3 TaxID=3134791 RepID=UPI003981E883
MATRIVHDKIPRNPRVVRARGKRTAQDTVTPSTRGIRTIAPSTIGIQDREYFSRVMTVAQAAGDALAICQKLRATGDAAAMKTADAAIKPIGKLLKSLDSVMREYVANSNDDPEDLDHSGTANAPTEGDPNAITSQDAAQVARIRHARFSTAAEQAAALGAYNPARVALGLPDEVPDDVYAFIGDVSKVSK